MWLLLFAVWAVGVALAFLLGGRNSGYGALIGGAAGLLGAFLAIRFLQRRRLVNRRPD